MIGTAVLPKPQHEGELGVGEGRALQIEGVLFPFVRLNVFHFEGIEGFAADGLRHADISALTDCVLFFLVGIHRFEVCRFHPNGNLCRRTCFYGDGRGGGVLLRRTRTCGVFAARILGARVVMEHEDLRIGCALGDAGVCQSDGRLGVDGKILVFDIEGLVGIFLVFFKLVVDVEALVFFSGFPVFVEGELVRRRQAIPSRYGVLDFHRRDLFVGFIAGRQIVPLLRLGVDDAACGFGGGSRTRRDGVDCARPTGDGRTDLDGVGEVGKVKVAVFDRSVVHFVVRGVFRGGRGGRRRGIGVIRTGSERRAHGGENHDR